MPDTEIETTPEHPYTNERAEVIGPNGEAVDCMWFAKCDLPANGLRPHPILDQVPICVRCDAKVERLS